MLYGPQVATVASLVTVWALATIALVLRLAARWMTKTQLWLDDIICVAAYLFGTAYNAWVLVWIRDGYGLRLDEITWLSRADAVSRARRDAYFCDSFSSLSIGASKLAMLALYWRVFSHTRIRYAILYLGFLSFCWLVARTTVSVIRCVPAESFWDTSVQGECFVDERKIVYGGSISHLILDSLILVLPLFELRKLRLQFWPKLGVVTTYMCGILTCLCAMGVVVSALRMPTEVKDTVQILDVEVNLSILTSCLPLLLPICELVRKHLCPATRLFRSCTPAGALPPPAPASGTDNEREQPPRPRQHFHSSMCLPTILSKSTMWSKLSSAAISKVNTGPGEGVRTAGNRTVMTVSHDEATSGVHVQLRREFRFISPPRPEPVPERPRKADSSTQPGTAGDAPTDGEARSKDEGDVVNQTKDGEGQAVEEGDSNVILPNIEGVAPRRTNAAAQLDEGNAAIEQTNEAARLESESAVSHGTHILPESRDDPAEGASAASFLKIEEQISEEFKNDTQEEEAAGDDASQPTLETEVIIEDSGTLTEA